MIDARVCIVLGLMLGARAQDLAPRAYLVTPVGSSAVTFSSSIGTGSISVDPTVPVENFKGSLHTSIAAYSHSFGFLGRSSNVTVFVPYAIGVFEGTVDGVPQQARRAGLADSRIRLTMNVRGGRAMSVDEYRSWQEKTTIGVSLTMLAPTGQYDPARLINLGGNRLAVKLELGLTRRWGKWMLDCYGGEWFFMRNDQFFPGGSSRTQGPISNGETHFGYYFKPRLWTSVDANFWTGGESAINGVPRPDQQRNSRVGATISIPATRHQSLKFGYSRGAYVTIGGNYRTVSAAWQYSWINSRR